MWAAGDGGGGGSGGSILEVTSSVLNSMTVVMAAQIIPGQLITHRLLDGEGGRAGWRLRSACDDNFD